MERFIVELTVANHCGVLNRITGLYARRKYNIDSLTVGETENTGFSRITVAFRGDEDIKERIVTQLEKLHDVKEVEVMDQHETVVRELLLLKVQNTAETRQDIMTVVEIFRAKIVDYSAAALICELTGETSKIDAFIDLMKSFGIMEMCRTGIVAIERGENCLRTLREQNTEV